MNLSQGPSRRGAPCGVCDFEEVSISYYYSDQITPFKEIEEKRNCGVSFSEVAAISRHIGKRSLTMTSSGLD